MDKSSCILCDEVSEGSLVSLVGCCHYFCTICVQSLIEQTSQGPMIKCPIDGERRPIQQRQCEMTDYNSLLIDPDSQTLELTNRQVHLQMKQQSHYVDQSLLSHTDIDINCQPVLNSHSYVHEAPACEEHGKPTDIICVNDLCFICTDCALFGKHRKHNVKSHQDIEKDVASLTQTYSSLLTKRKDAKEATSMKKTETAAKLHQKTTQLKASIANRFAAWRALLDQCERNAFSKFDEIVVKHQSKLAKQEQKINEQSTVWQETVNHQLAYLDISTGDTIINALYGTKTVSLIQQGKALAFEFVKHAAQVSTININLISGIKISMAGKALDLTIQNACKIDETGPLIKRMNVSGVRSRSPLATSPLHNFRNSTQRSRLQSSQTPLARNSWAAQRNSNSRFQSTIITTPTKSRVQNNHQSTNYKEAKYEQILTKLTMKPQQIVDLSSSGLTNDMIPHVLARINQLGGVRTLKLMNNKLTDACIPQLLAGLGSIQVINLSYNQLSSRLLSQVLQRLDELPKLKSLVVSHNRIDTRQCRDRLMQLKSSGIIVTI